jgi:hypothetical protein
MVIHLLQHPWWVVVFHDGVQKTGFGASGVGVCEVTATVNVLYNGRRDRVVYDPPYWLLVRFLGSVENLIDVGSLGSE